MTVLMREEMNDADIAWAAADACVGRVAEQLLRARHDVGVESRGMKAAPKQRDVIEPTVLRARGAL